MPDTTTTTYGFTKPEVGASDDTWGGKLNGNWDDVDDLLDGTTPISGNPNFTGDPAFPGSPDFSGADNKSTIRSDLGLVKQTSDTDTTSGSLLLVGAFGLGETGTVTEISDIDATNTASGVYQFTNTTTNRASLPTPLQNLWGIIVVRRYNASTLSQEAYRTTFDDGRWFRVYANSAWSDWYQVYDQSTVLGTVSETSGVPTGALMESGNNSNGYYARFANGWQICTEFIGVAASTHSWTFPAAFSASGSGQISLFAMPRQTSNPRIVTENANLSTTSANFNVWNENGVAVTASVYLGAIGRWF